jgi:hypothetical protein
MADKEQEELENPKTWDWERAETRPGRKKPRAVVSVAFKRDDFETVALCAERAQMRISEFIRSAVLDCAAGKNPPVSVTGGSPGAGSVGYLPPPTASTRAGTQVREEYAQSSAAVH